MKYILMMNCPKTGYDTFGAWPKKDIEAHMAFMRSFSRSSANPESWCPTKAWRPERGQARAGREGRHARDDGIFPEAKEFLAGYWIVDVETPEQAYAIAARASAAPGPGGRPLNMAIEVRQVMSGPPEEWL